MWHHPATSELEAGIILLSGATTRECSNATLFQFRTSRWFKPAWSRSIWSIDAIGFCFARVMWRSMASVLDLYSFNPFFMRCIYVPLIKRSGSHSAMPCQTFSQVQYRLCIRDFATLFAVPFPGVAQCSWLPPPAGDWDELFKNLFAAAFSICPISRKVLFPRLIARLMKQWPRVVDWGISGPNP